MYVSLTIYTCIKDRFKDKCVYVLSFFESMLEDYAAVRCEQGCAWMNYLRMNECIIYIHIYI